METWKLSTDPQFIDKVRDIVGLYLDPPQWRLITGVRIYPEAALAW